MRQRTWVPLLASTLALASCATRGPTPPAPASTGSAPAKSATLSVPDARHVLGRLAFGPRPGDAERLSAEGLAPWLDRQLGKAPPDPELERALEPYRPALATPEDLAERFLGEDWDEDTVARGIDRTLRQRAKSQLAGVAVAEITRHIVSQRQVEEVMVDLWTNHFNVFGQKGLVRLFAGDFVERAIRPHALGRFEDLLLATARHPAMLLYLDNARSRKESAPVEGKKRRGLNENYARELLELHTLGVDGGYEQSDVREAARVLTGWSVERPREGGLGFRFRPGAHDSGEKHVLGERFADDGEAEGKKLITLLARHPSTARHVAKKLCVRFVADEPPATCIEQAARTFRESDGDIARVIRSIVLGPTLLSADVRDKKLKSPLELVVSSARALGATPDGSLALARVLGRLGEPLLLESVPTGYPEEQAEWTSSSGMLSRMGFATELGAGRVPGLSLDLARALPDAREKLVPRAQALLLGERARPETLEVVRRELSRVEGDDERRAVVVALLVGSPEFQRQ